ncbi:MAG: protein translocase subunit SecF [Candidatus Magasanikbacteria bacterium]|nr:protein translocase subunit SecF [Candidatus Magasanikbacteria bacterium]
MTNFNLVKNQKYFLTFSGVLIVSGLLAVLIWGLKPGLDFTGGSLLEVAFQDTRPDSQAVEQKISSDKPILIPAGENDLIIKMKAVDEATHQKILSSLKDLGGGADKVTEKRFEMIGPTVSAELKTKSFLAIVFVLVAIILYIAFAFRKVSRPISSWKYGVCAVLALFHDVIIPTGVFAVLGHFLGVEVDTLFVTALLTVLGFSVHDTIVVYDRIRENLLKFPRETFEQVVNRSVNQTAVRSINTSLTVLLVLLATFFFGGESVKYFVLTLIIGVVFGTYSSIFIASPLLVIWNRAGKK